MAEDESLNEITGRIEGLTEAIKKLEAAERRKTTKATPPPAVEERRSLYRTIGTVTGVALVAFVLLAALSMLLRAGVLG